MGATNHGYRMGATVVQLSGSPFRQLCNCVPGTHSEQYRRTEAVGCQGEDERS